MMSRPKGRVHVRWAPRPEVKVPATVVKRSVIAAMPKASPSHAMASSMSRNSTPIPSETMIEGTMRLATAV